MTGFVSSRKEEIERNHDELKHSLSQKGGLKMATVQVNNISISYVEKGTGEEVIVFIHGFIASKGHWKEVMELLPDGYHSYAFDLRGSGEVGEVKEGFTIAQFARDIHAAAQELGLERYVVAGHSTGGAVAQQMALDFPECVKALVLIGTVSCFGCEPPSALLYPVIKLIDASQEELEATLPAFYPQTPSPERIKELANDVRSMTKESFFGTMDTFRFFNQEARMSEIKVPTIFLTGSLDLFMTQGVIQRAAAGIAGAKIVYIEGNGHWVMIENGSRTVELITQFVDEVNQK